MPLSSIFLPISLFKLYGVVYVLLFCKWFDHNCMSLFRITYMYWLSLESRFRVQNLITGQLWKELEYHQLTEMTWNMEQKSIYIKQKTVCHSVCSDAFHAKTAENFEKSGFKYPHLNSSWSVVGIFNLTSEVIRGHLEASFYFKVRKRFCVMIYPRIPTPSMRWNWKWPLNGL